MPKAKSKPAKINKEVAVIAAVFILTSLLIFFKNTQYLYSLIFASLLFLSKSLVLKIRIRFEGIIKLLTYLFLAVYLLLALQILAN